MRRNAVCDLDDMEPRPRKRLAKEINSTLELKSLLSYNQEEYD